MSVVTSPDYTDVVNQQLFLRPLGGPQHPMSYLDRFPDEVYNKGVDSHLVKFIYSLLGPAGVGWLRKNYLDARLKLEDFGIEGFDLDRFYGDPLRFGRILEEIYEADPSGLLPRDQWEEIRAKDAAYRNRAIDYVNGARAGNTPFGIHLVARSGLGHEVEIVENYKYIYDQLSDDPIGLENFGKTNSTEEFIVIPRRELPQSEKQIIRIFGSPTGGTLTIFFPVGNEATNQTISLDHDVDRFAVQTALGAIPSIGLNNVIVEGGPFPDKEMSVTFTGELAYKNVPQLQVSHELTGSDPVLITVETMRGGIDQTDEVVSIGARDRYYLKSALDNIKPVASIVSFGMGNGLKSHQTFNNVFATSTYSEVVRYVTGQAGVAWPERRGVSWIEKNVEHQAPRKFDDLSNHYRGFHNVSSVYAYGDSALDDSSYLDDIATVSDYGNDHIGPFSSYQRTLFPVLNTTQSPDYQHRSDMALADYAEPLSVTVTTTEDIPTGLVNGMYPTGYSSLSGVPEIRYKDEQFWASVEREVGSEYLEVDLGEVRAVNYIYFEITRKPCDIEIDYDLLDLNPSRLWEPITVDSDTRTSLRVGYDGAINPWNTIEVFFTNSLNSMVYTRNIRLKLARRADLDSPFVDNQTNIPYSIEVRNLRIGRNVS